jgi:hypothetical protein
VLIALQITFTSLTKRMAECIALKDVLLATSNRLNSQDASLAKQQIALSVARPLYVLHARLDSIKTDKVSVSNLAPLGSISLQMRSGTTIANHALGSAGTAPHQILVVSALITISRCIASFWTSQTNSSRKP